MADSTQVLLRANGLGKKYARSLRQAVNYGMRDVMSEMFGRKRQAQLRQDEFWALKDVGFELARGECLAVLGSNGAGKSTLLKLLSGMLLPDGGSIERHGRMEKMIELSGGFSPQLTGRENVALRARLLGLTATQLAQRIDEIVDFAEIAEFIDTPVQFYSSGMRSRLGFALSVVMQPDILIIDEVLAVGDLGFRMKCYERVDQMRASAAVILVSHSMNHVARMASRALVLHKGRVAHLGDVQTGIATYHELSGAHQPGKRASHHPELVEFSLTTPAGRLEDGDTLPFGSNAILEASHAADEALSVSVILGEVKGHALVEWNSRRSGLTVPPGAGFKLDLGRLELCPGAYHVSLVGFAPDGRQVFLSEPLHLKIDGDYFNNIRIQPRGSWTLDDARLAEPHARKASHV